MNIHEYQAKELLQKFDVATTRGRVATTLDEAEQIARELGDIGGRVDDPIRLWGAPQERWDGAAVAAPCSHFGKLRVAWDVEAPALVIAEMKMKAIELPPS